MSKKELSDYFAKMGSKGGKAKGASKARSPSQARKAAQARWERTIGSFVQHTDTVNKQRKENQ